MSISQSVRPKLAKFALFVSSSVERFGYAVARESFSVFENIFVIVLVLVISEETLLIPYDTTSQLLFLKIFGFLVVASVTTVVLNIPIRTF